MRTFEILYITILLIILGFLAIMVWKIETRAGKTDRPYPDVLVVPTEVTCHTSPKSRVPGPDVPRWWT